MTDQQPKVESSSATWRSILRKKKIEMGRAVSPTPSELEADNEAEEGSIIQSNVLGRMFTLHDGNILKKAGRGVQLGEADALRVAEAGGIPVPHVHGTETTPEGRKRIAMDYIEGTTLSDVWPDLSEDEKRAYAHQLRGILTKMREIPPPQGDYRRLRRIHVHTSPVCYGEDAFKEYLLSALHRSIPQAVRNAFAQRLAKQPPHRIVLTHGDLAPRNVMVRDGKIAALVDWEDAGWYPEWWEYAKLFQRMVSMEKDWSSYAADIFPQDYPDELVDYTAISRWQNP
ncbi:hypothetical protein SEUCBS140593_008279 [Sporothrix eucalyptigena]|uniref:Aminoglycoside phosphotransferase domain-containing protein n=1 Tax=Sporothrix eucalyptigena TaxID=1812306 RepID=A0ABP0CKJ7_9PEZI